MLPKTTLFLKPNHGNPESQLNVARYKFTKILRNVIFQSDLLLLLQDLFGCQFLHYIHILVLYMQIHVWDTLWNFWLQMINPIVLWQKIWISNQNSFYSRNNWIERIKFIINKLIVFTKSWKIIFLIIKYIVFQKYQYLLKNLIKCIC